MSASNSPSSLDLAARAADAKAAEADHAAEQADRAAEQGEASPPELPREKGSCPKCGEPTYFEVLSNVAQTPFNDVALSDEHVCLPAEDNSSQTTYAEDLAASK